MSDNIFKYDNVEVCRCQYTDFYRYGFADYHYFNTICKGALCCMLYIDGKVVGFGSLLSMPIKGHTDCLIFHRVVILPSWQGKGVGAFLTLFMCGIWKSIGRVIYMKVQSKKIGKWHESESQLWKPTAMNRKSRKFTHEDKLRNKSRYRKSAFSHEYIGREINGYEWMTKPVAELRSKNLLYERCKVEPSEIYGQLWGIASNVIRDFNRMSIDEIKQKYHKTYPYFIHSEIPCDKTHSLRLPDDYMVMRLNNVDGTTKTYRKRLLYLNAMLRRKINNDIAVEHLIYCLMCDNITYGFGLSVGEIFKMSRKVMKLEVSRIKILYSSKTSYRVNVNEAVSRGLTIKQASNMVRGEITSNRIGELYNPLYTDEENIKMFSANGLCISIKTLKRWRKANGIFKYKRKRDIQTT